MDMQLTQPIRQEAAMQRRPWWPAVAVVTSYALVSLLLFWPVLRQPATVVGTLGPGVPEDAWQNVWMVWWFHRAVTSGQNPFWTTMLFYPEGVNLFWQTFNSTNGLLGLPLTAAFNAITAFNTIALLTFIGSACTMFLLARRLVGGYGGPWVAGILFAFSPFHLSKLYDGQLEVMSIQYFPLLVLWLIYAFEERRWRYVLLSGLLLLWITLTSLYYGLFSLLYLGLYAGLLALRQRSWVSLWGIVRRGTFLIAPLAVVLLPQVIGYRTSNNLPEWQRIAHSAQPLDFFLPSPFNPLWGDRIARLQAAWHPGVGAINISLGLMVFVLAIAGAVLCRKQAWSWVVLTGAVMVLAMGPVLVVNGYNTNVPLPYALVALLPAVKLGQRPNHLIAIASVLLALLAAYGWRALATRIAPTRRGLAVAAALLLLAVDLWPRPLDVAAMEVSPFYRQLPPAAQGAILELPFELDTSNAMQVQMLHGRPILGGYLARIPPYDFVNQTDGIRQLWTPAQRLGSVAYVDWTEAVVPVLGAYDIEYVVLHLDRLRGSVADELRTALQARLEQVYADDTLVAYHRPSAVQPAPFLSLGQGWYRLEAQGDQRWQWTTGSAEIVLQNPAATELTIMLGARLSTPQDQPVRLYQQVGTGWRLLATFASTPTPRSVGLPLQLPPGQTVFRWETATQPEALPGQPPRDLGALWTRLEVTPMPAP